MDELPNKLRNDEVMSVIGELDKIGNSHWDIKLPARANALAALNIAESTQFLAVKIEESSVQNEKAIKMAFAELIKSNENVASSNEKYSRSMKCLTIANIVALVVVGLLQVLVPVVISFTSQTVTGIK